MSPTSDADIYSQDIMLRAYQRSRAQDAEDFERQAEACAFCARPVRLVGRADTVDASTGAVVASYDTAKEPSGVTYKACGNRRASVCPACSRIYAADAFHLFRAGTAGGDKGVPEHVRFHPKVFATLTAPSFGAVHVRRRPGSSSTSRCRPRRDKKLCPHGRATWCMAVHDDTDGRVGQPLCPDCYDYDAHVIWQWWAPELWRRFTICLRRSLAGRLGVPDSRLNTVASLPFAKVTEYQVRGAVHFHAVIRLDGPRSSDDLCPPPTPGLTSADLAMIVRDAAAATWLDAPDAAAPQRAHRLRFGAQVDVRPIALDGPEDNSGQNDGALSEQAVAGYLAKYVTKATDDLDPGDRARNAHVRRLAATVERVAEQAAARDESTYRLLARHHRSLGYRGHCASRSRTFSTTMRALRQARQQHARRAALARRGVTIDIGADLADTEETDTLTVVSTWRFVGMGWTTEGDAALAALSAAVAREHAREQAAARRASRPHCASSR